MKTHEIKGAKAIWNNSKTIDLTFGNRFSMWKFCVLMHKILHDGHSQVLSDGLLFQEQLIKYANYWRAQSSDYAMSECIVRYCQVLNRKISFHNTYPMFKGSFRLNDDSCLDVNSSFALCLDICDYLEDLLQLQRAVFQNLAMHNISADSKKGSCRLLPLVTIIDECGILYEHCVTVLQSLHYQMPTEDISGLADRFSSVIFHELLYFFEYVRSNNLTPNSVEIPTLPMAVPIQVNRVVADLRHFPEPSAPSIMDFMLSS
ncbi:huntingtin-interacting protein 1 isoform X2 [Stomoxys calcitrans]|nr:huntingtin-interacting protein 1 isoform X2 [Stomoxys calcitrans]